MRTEDHPLAYLEFEGEIPEGEYGAGTMRIWDSGTYDCEKFKPEKVIVVLHGERASGRYALFRTRDNDWMIHRMDPPAGGEPMPDRIEPMRACLGKLPSNQDDYGYEIKWDGVRAVVYSEWGKVRAESRNLRDITAQYPELRELGRALGSRRAVLDGEIVAFDEEGKPSFERLQSRMHLASESLVRRRMRVVPVTYILFDLVYLDGRSLLGDAYTERRRALEELELSGPSWQTPATHPGEGAELLEVTKRHGLEGLVAKRLDSAYESGRRSRAWIKVKNVRRQELVVGGWMPGEGRRRQTIGALLVGHYERDGDESTLRYAGRVGTGFSDAELTRLQGLMRPLERADSPFGRGKPPRTAQFIEPQLVADVEFAGWTREGILRAPSYKGMRDDRDPLDVVREDV